MAREEALDGLRRRGEDGAPPARTRPLLVRVNRVGVGVRVGVRVGAKLGVKLGVGL